MKWAGLNVKMVLNGSHYRAGRCSVRTQAQALPCPDSEGVPANQGLNSKQPTATISGTTNAVPSVVTTSAAHGVIQGQYIQITGCDATSLNGFWQAATVTSTTITLNNVTLPGSAGTTGTVKLGGVGGVGTMAVVAGPKGGVIQASKLSWEDDQNPFDSPFLLAEQTYDRVQIYPNGVTPVGGQTTAPLFDFYSALCTEVSFDNDVQNLEPLMIGWSSDGNYLLPK